MGCRRTGGVRALAGPHDLLGPPVCHGDRVRGGVRSVDGGQLGLAHHPLHRRTVGRGRPRRGLLRAPRAARPVGHDRARVRRRGGVRTGGEAASLREVRVQRRSGRHFGRCRRARFRPVGQCPCARGVRQRRCRARRRGVLPGREHLRHGHNHVDLRHAVAPHRLRRHQGQIARDRGRCRDRRARGAAAGRPAQVPAGGGAPSPRPALPGHGALLCPPRPVPAPGPLRRDARRQPVHGDRGDQGRGAGRRGLVAPVPECHADARAARRRRPRRADDAGGPDPLAGRVRPKPHRALRRRRPVAARSARVRGRHRPGQCRSLWRGAAAKGKALGDHQQPGRGRLRHQ